MAVKSATLHLAVCQTFVKAQFLHAGLLERDVVVVVEIVDAHYPVAFAQQPAGKMKTYESGHSGNEYFHNFD